MALGVASDVADFLGELDELLVLDPRARGTRDDVQPVLRELGHRAEAAVRDVAQDVVPGDDLFGFPGVRQRQRDPDGVSDPPTEELFERDPGLDDPLRGQPGFSDAEMEEALPEASRRTSGCPR